MGKYAVKGGLINVSKPTDGQAPHHIDRLVGELLRRILEVQYSIAILNAAHTALKAAPLRHCGKERTSFSAAPCN
ncbi:hypothetical protein [Lysobacter sp. Root604]|uniref:hypothetical protein n=1 Tax=Lysobacter sp. Root604 TaxID=1736568 RepID=UPI0012FCCE4D|nr:hypothetical protein [Lysobacter sp. Root604]